MLKKCLSIMIAAIMLICVFAVMPASASAKDTDLAESGATSLPNSLFLQQTTSGMCTLSSTAMMLRARMYLSGNSDWDAITESAIRSDAWYEGVGLRYNFTYTRDGNSMTVSHNTISGISVSGLKSLLNSHPEGIVLHCYDIPHAVLVTDYQGDTFYCADPAPTYSKTRRTLASSYSGQMLGSQSAVLGAADAYWYVSSYSITGNIDLGKDFYAMIANSSNNKAVGLDSDWNVTVRNYEGDNSQIWHFIRQSDGGYRLINVYTDIFLIGDNIASLEPQAGPNNKTWYVRKIGSGYGLAHYSGGVTKYLRPHSNSWTNGTILTLSTTKSNVNINIISGSSNKPKNFTFSDEIEYTHEDMIEVAWNKSKFANSYTVTVWKDNGEKVLSTTTRENSIYLFDLETGYYGVYVKAQNAIGNSDNAITHFHVTKDFGDQDFTAIITDNGELAAAYDVNAIILDTYQQYNNQVWNFLFQPDGSYLIQNQCTDTYLAANANGVFLSENADASAKWYLGGYEDDELTYLYHVAAGSTLKLSPTDNLWEDGATVGVTTDYWAFCQLMMIESPEIKENEILGDADGDEVITIMDVTAIQKRLANIPVSLTFSETAADVSEDGLDITDAGNIQKYISRMDVPYAIGKRIGEEPETEPETEAETEALSEMPTEEGTQGQTDPTETDPPETQEPQTAKPETMEQTETQTAKGRRY